MTISRADAQHYVSTEIQRIFIEERLAFEFSGGLVRRRGRRNTVERLSRAELVLGDSRLGSARAHFNKAMPYFKSVSSDPENAVKEAVCAVSSHLPAQSLGQLPKSIAQTFTGLYGFRNAGEGISHGGAKGGVATIEIAEYALAVAASHIVLFVDLAAAQEGDVPC